MDNEADDRDEEQVCVRFLWTAGDYGRYLQAVALQSPVHRGLRNLARLAPLAVVGAFTINALLVKTNLGHTALNMLPWLTMSLLWWSLVFQAHRILPHLLTRRFPPRQEERKLSRDGLDVAGTTDATFVPWNQMRRIVESDEYFLFYQDGPTPQYIPKQTLRAEQLAGVRALIERCLPSSAKKVMLPAS